VRKPFNGDCLKNGLIRAINIDIKKKRTSKSDIHLGGIKVNLNDMTALGRFF
jgi:hypothetical protein